MDTNYLTQFLCWEVGDSLGKWFWLSLSDEVVVKMSAWAGGPTNKIAQQYGYCTRPHVFSTWTSSYSHLSVLTVWQLTHAEQGVQEREEESPQLLWPGFRSHVPHFSLLNRGKVLGPAQIQEEGN